MPEIKDYIPEYTPLWRGEEQCNKCDAIIIPANEDFQVMIPAPTELVAFYLVLNGSDTDSYIVFDTAEQVGDYIYANISTGFDGSISMRTFEGLEFLLPCGCYQFELGSVLINDPEEGVTRLGIKWTFAVLCESDCRDAPLKLEYELDCGDDALQYTYFLDGALVRQPLELADEVNAIDGTGRSRRVFSRLQTNKELRLRPLTLATHELLEGILNQPSFTIDGTEYTPAEGEVYTYVDAGASGYYVGRVGLSASGKVLRLCCDSVSPSS
jgi:hypothetical protein